MGRLTNEKMLGFVVIHPVNFSLMLSRETIVAATGY